MKKSMMKKVLLGLCAVSAVAIMAGCGGGDSKPASSAQPAANTGDLVKTIKEKGVLTVGTASGYPPYEFIDASQKDKVVIGVDMELAKKIAEKLGVKLEVADSNFTALLSSLTAGKVDMAIAGMNETEERKKTMDFSNGYLPAHEKIMIRKADIGKFKTLADFKGKTLGAQKATTEEAIAQKELTESKLVLLDHVPDVVMELKHGKVDGLVVQDIVAQQYLVFNDDLVLSDVNFETSKEMYTVVALPKNNPELMKIVNEVIKENTDNGNFDKWVKEASQKAVENAKQ